MIAHPDAEDAVAVLAGHLRREASRRLGDLGVPSLRIEAVCGAVARFCVEECAGARLDDGYVLRLVARALHAAGETSAADRLGHAVPGAERRATSFDPFVRSGRLSHDVYRLLAGGCLRPSAWVAHPEEIVWVVDLAAIRGGAAAADLPVLAFQVLRRLADVLAAAWTPERGRLLFALRGRGGGAGRRDEMSDFLRDALELAYRRRGLGVQCRSIVVGGANPHGSPVR
jgi:hypothetical protein